MEEKKTSSSNEFLFGLLLEPWSAVNSNEEKKLAKNHHIETELCGTIANILN